MSGMVQSLSSVKRSGLEEFFMSNLSSRMP
jgi:hypothetical protein